ncbi:hypothetical protein [Streptomyces umbrinus]|uniref:hypothetical protein n=1 Tax=Streptomyces umbrinus TaxID=67370 RepID=UPI00342BE08D
MRNKHVIIVIGLVVVAGIAATLWAFLRPTYGDTVSACEKALASRAEGNKAKPDACDGVKDDDYDALIMSKVIDDLGWTDDEGNFDKNKMIEDGLDDDQP